MKSGKETEKKSVSFADAMIDFVELYQARREDAARKLGLTIAEFKLLRAFGVERTRTVGELANRMKLSSSRLTRILDGLVEKGTVTRDVGAQDRRVIFIALTSQGRKVQSNVEMMNSRMHDEIFMGISEGGIQTLKSIIERALASMQQQKEQK